MYLALLIVIIIILSLIIISSSIINAIFGREVGLTSSQIKKLFFFTILLIVMSLCIYTFIPIDVIYCCSDREMTENFRGREVEIVPPETEVGAGSLTDIDIKNMTDKQLRDGAVRARDHTGNAVRRLQERYPNNMATDNINFRNLGDWDVEQITRRMKDIIQQESNRDKLVSEIKLRGLNSRFSDQSKGTLFIKAYQEALHSSSSSYSD